MITGQELKNRVSLMSDFGVSKECQLYLIESCTDVENDDIISLVDDLSSKVWWFCAAQGTAEMKMRGEAHLEARRKLIEKIKGLRS